MPHIRPGSAHSSPPSARSGAAYDVEAPRVRSSRPILSSHTFRVRSSRPILNSHTFSVLLKARSGKARSGRTIPLRRSDPTEGDRVRALESLKRLRTCAPGFRFAELSEPCYAVGTMEQSPKDLERERHHAEAIKKRLATRARLTAEQIAELDRDICEFDSNPRPPEPGEYAFCIGLNEPDQYWDSDFSVIGYARYVAARCIDWTEAVYNSLYGYEEPLRLEKRTQYGGLIWNSLPLPAKLRVEAHFIREYAASGDINPPSSFEDAALWLEDVARELEAQAPHS